jgi:conjugal transfer pilus assembly protein TraV
MKRNLTTTLATTFAAVGLLAGCSITGMSASSSYGCKAPEGVKCDSVSGTYYNALANNLPSQRRTSSEPAHPPQPSAPTLQDVRYDASTSPVTLASLASTVGLGDATQTPARPQAQLPASLRSGPRISRLWIKPWEDSDGDLHGESLVYVQLEGGRWLVDHAQRQVREAYAPVRAVGSRAPQASALDQARPQAAAVLPTMPALSRAVPSALAQPLHPLVPRPTPTTSDTSN